MCSSNIRCEEYNHENMGVPTLKNLGYDIFTGASLLTCLFYSSTTLVKHNVFIHESPVLSSTRILWMFLALEFSGLSHGRKKVTHLNILKSF